MCFKFINYYTFYFLQTSHHLTWRAVTRSGIQMSLSWVNCFEIGNENDGINRKLNNAFIGLPDSGTEYCISRVPGCHSKDPGFSSWEGKLNSSFLVFDHCVGERMIWRWWIGRSLKFLRSRYTHITFAIILITGEL